MASAVDVCNLALAHLGDAAEVTSISPPDGSAQAAHCARFYPIARDVVLEQHTWAFATRRAVLAEVADAAPDSWTYAYAMPSGALKPIKVLPNGAADDHKGSAFAYESAADGTLLIYTHEPTASAQYVARVTDTTKFSPLFVAALSRLLAAYLAGPIIKGNAGVKVGEAMYKTYLFELGRAAASDANARHTQPEHSPDWIAGR